MKKRIGGSNKEEGEEVEEEEDEEEEEKEEGKEEREEKKRKRLLGKINFNKTNETCFEALLSIEGNLLRHSRNGFGVVQKLPYSTDPNLFLLMIVSKVLDQ